jgi:hypothetical protein
MEEPAGTAVPDSPAEDTPEKREIRRLRRENAAWRLKLREAQRRAYLLEGQLSGYREIASSLARGR